MIKTLSQEVARFIQSRFGELKISEARYKDLLGEVGVVIRSTWNILIN